MFLLEEATKWGGDRQLLGVKSHIVWMVEERFKRKEVSFYKTEAFSERLAKGFV